MANNLSKYIWLLETINSKGRATFSTIQRAWETTPINDTKRTLPRRTFYFWKEDIKKIFHLNIECDKTMNEYYIANSEDIASGSLTRWLLNTFAVTNLIFESKEFKDKILLEHMPSDTRFLATVMEAIRDGLKLNVTYQKFKDAVPYDFIMEPYCVKVFKQRWYMVGQSSKHPGEIRVYALDRVHAMQVTKESYKIPFNFDGQLYFSGSYGVIAGENKPTNILIKVAAPAVPYIKTLPLHSSQKEIEHNTEYSIFQFFVAPTYDFIQELRTYGADIEVLAPKKIVDDFVKLTEEYCKIYGK